MDKKDYERLIGCFVTDSVWERQGQSLTAADQSVNALQNGCSSTLITLHSVTNLTLELKSARARFCLTVLLDLLVWLHRPKPVSTMCRSLEPRRRDFQPM